ncbi:hypothetical protein Q7P37_000633 [Cladosporium fusiforme]
MGAGTDTTANIGFAVVNSDIDFDNLKALQEAFHQDAQPTSKVITSNEHQLTATVDVKTGEPDPGQKGSRKAILPKPSLHAPHALSKYHSQVVGASQSTQTSRGRRSHCFHWQQWLLADRKTSNAEFAPLAGFAWQRCGLAGWERQQESGSSGPLATAGRLLAAATWRSVMHYPCGVVVVVDSTTTRSADVAVHASGSKCSRVQQISISGRRCCHPIQHSIAPTHAALVIAFASDPPSLDSQPASLPFVSSNTPAPFISPHPTATVIITLPTIVNPIIASRRSRLKECRARLLAVRQRPFHCQQRPGQQQQQQLSPPAPSCKTCQLSSHLISTHALSLSPRVASFHHQRCLSPVRVATTAAAQIPLQFEKRQPLQLVRVVSPSSKPCLLSPSAPVRSAFVFVSQSQHRPQLLAPRSPGWARCSPITPASPRSLHTCCTDELAPRLPSVKHTR